MVMQAIDESMVVFDAGYDAPRMAHLPRGLPVEILGRMRTDRVMRKPVPVPWISPPQGGRPPRHGKEFRFAKPETWGEPDAATTQGGRTAVLPHTTTGVSNPPRPPVYELGSKHVAPSCDFCGHRADSAD